MVDPTDQKTSQLVSSTYKFWEDANALTIIGLVIAAVTLFAGWWFFYSPRKIRLIAKASFPFMRTNPAIRPFDLFVTNTNTRQVSIDKVGFETIGRKERGRKTFTHELTMSTSLFPTDKLLITESENAKMSFDVDDIIHQLTSGLKGFGLPLNPVQLKIWLYITHGKKFPVEVDENLSSHILVGISSNTVE